MTQYTIKITCDSCKGVGTVIENGAEKPCIDCNQTGYEMVGVIDGAEQIDWIKKKLKLILKALNLPEE